jgi:hypothetical protein
MSTKMMADDFSEVKADRPTKITVTFEIGTGHNQDVLALIERLLTDPSMQVGGVGHNFGMIDKAPVIPAKPRKVRVYTEEDRKAFRQRMIDARAAKLEKLAKEEEAKKVAKPKKEAKPKVESKPVSEGNHRGRPKKSTEPTDMPTKK